MDVTEWTPGQQIVVPHLRRPRRFWPPTVIGVLGTLSLHAALVQSLYFESSARKVPSVEINDSRSTFAKSNADSTESLVIVEIADIDTKDRYSEAGASPPGLSKLKPVSLVDLGPPPLMNLANLTLGEDEQPQEAARSGDSAERVRLAGIYSGQIRARIDRLWLRPRSPVNEAPTADESFQCQVQIVQDGMGNVQEILLARCNGSPAWQRSLVVAIQQASPLPAPPSAKVFSHSIALSFVGFAFAPGSTDDEYEIVPTAVGQVRLAQPALAPTQSRRELPHQPSSPEPTTNVNEAARTD